MEPPNTGKMCQSMALKTRSWTASLAAREELTVLKASIRVALSQLQLPTLLLLPIALAIATLHQQHIVHQPPIVHLPPIISQTIAIQLVSHKFKFLAFIALDIVSEVNY